MIESEFFDLALKTWGLEAQLTQAIQELAEFTVEITKRQQGRGKPAGSFQSPYLEEMADAYIMLGQLVRNEVNHNPGAWESILSEKMDRLRKRLGADPGYVSREELKDKTFFETVDYLRKQQKLLSIIDDKHTSNFQKLDKIREVLES